MAKQEEKKKEEEKDLLQPEEETVNEAAEPESGELPEEPETKKTPKEPEAEEALEESEDDGVPEESEDDGIPKESEAENSTEEGETGETPRETAVEEPAEKSREPRTLRQRLRNLSILAAVIAGLYFGIGGYYCFHYLPNTVINGIACARMSSDALFALFAEQVDDYALTLEECDGNTEVLSGAAFALRAANDGTLDGILREQNSFLWPRAFWRDSVYSPDTTVEWDAAQLAEALAGLICMDESRMDEPKNAEVVYSENEEAFLIAEAEYGTLLLPDAFRGAVEEAVSSLEDTLNLAESGCYAEPEITEDSPELVAACAEMNAMIDLTIVYDMLDLGEIPITKEQMSSWVTINAAMTVSYNWKAIADFVADFAAQYDTRGKEHTLETSWGDTVTITVGDYGWELDQQREVQELLADLHAGSDVTREPAWACSAQSHGGKDYGDTYVEVNLTEQYLYFYKEGELIVESDFVSGSVADGNATHTGIYAIKGKSRDVTLRGPDYATPVSFWMPFNGGEGLHDATWRSRFGGTIYRKNGSHGCINLPYEVAEAVFEKIEVGDCVIVY